MAEELANKDLTSTDAILEPLHLKVTELSDTVSQNPLITCLLCDETFDNNEKENNKLLKHLLELHKLVIGEVTLIADLPRYVEYWKKRFSEGHALRHFCSVINTNSQEKDIGVPDQYYLLCDLLPEDKQLRQYLQHQKLERVLACQHKEREDDNFTHDCLFCREHFIGNRSMVFNHMAQDHSFNVGQPDNIVYASEFLDLLQSKLSSLQCLYCEKVFKDRMTLKDHMRKKQHKKINPKNKIYDRFYIINYLELGKNWEAIQSEIDIPTGDDTDTEDAEDWSDWQEEGGANAICLFCDERRTNVDLLMEHLKAKHSFDLERIKQSLNLTFYQKLKLVNYIRRQVHHRSCILCQDKFNTKDELLDHMSKTGHISSLPERTVWDSPQYYFPTYENDDVLYGLGDDDTEEEDTVVVPETMRAPETSILQNDDVRHYIMNTS